MAGVLPGQWRTRAIDRADDTRWLAAEMERLATTLPAMGDAAGDPVAWAVDYVQRVDGDVVQLGCGADFLFAALERAEAHDDHGTVVRLVDGLTPLATYQTDSTGAERALWLGIAACRRLGDRRHLALFLNRLGGALFVRGHYQRGRALWHAGIAAAEDARDGSGVWRPLASFAQIADILGGDPSGPVHQGMRLSARLRGDPGDFAVALLIRGLLRRFAGDDEHAYCDFGESLHALAALTSAPSHTVLLLTLLCQAEMARIRGEYRMAQAYAESAYVLARAFCDTYTMAALVIDQGRFAREHEQFDDLAHAYQRLRLLVAHLGAGHVQTILRGWAAHLHQVVESVPASLPLAAPALTPRETELLRLVALGLPDREVAERLVVATATVKKHLQHIYAKLEVPNRTMAVAHAHAAGILP